jgi:divinyl chlorophyllide a 8-vinyl-reductase
MEQHSTAMHATEASPFTPQRVLLFGGTGTIGQATVRALQRLGHAVVCVVRARAGVGGAWSLSDCQRLLPGAQLRVADVGDPASLLRDAVCGEHFDAVVSCLASRTGAPQDAWAIDHRAQLHALDAARQAGAAHFVLLSAICVQKPLLAFQHAKLAFEQALIDSGLRYSIVRPTAFFKSLSGQIERVRKGKPFLLFGDGTLTACMPISDDDLGDYLAACLHTPERHNCILPIGGPGPAITPRAQGEQLFALLGQPPRFKQVPVAVLDGIIAVLSALGRLFPALRAKAELARIGRYYATESMLVRNPQTGQYDAAATPSTGSQTLFAYYAEVLGGKAAAQRGEHAVF